MYFTDSTLTISLRPILSEWVEILDMGLSDLEHSTVLRIQKSTNLDLCVVKFWTLKK